MVNSCGRDCQFARSAGSCGDSRPRGPAERSSAASLGTQHGGSFRLSSRGRTAVAAVPTLSLPLASVDLGDEVLIFNRRADVLGLIHWRELNGFRSEIFVRNEREQVPDDIEAGTFLVFRIDHVPGSLLDVGDRKHFVLGAGILGPTRPGLQVHSTEFPALGHISHAILKTTLLFFIADREPVFYEDDARADQNPFDFSTAVK